MHICNIYAYLIKIRQVAAESFHVARRTDRKDKDIATFRKFATAPKIITFGCTVYQLSTATFPYPNYSHTI
jgi:hypothetical protein